MMYLSRVSCRKILRVHAKLLELPLQNLVWLINCGVLLQDIDRGKNVLVRIKTTLVGLKLSIHPELLPSDFPHTTMSSHSRAPAASHHSRSGLRDRSLPLGNNDSEVRGELFYITTAVILRSTTKVTLATLVMGSLSPGLPPAIAIILVTLTPWA